MEYADFMQPSVKGAGVVLFEADSCLASKRREYRRMRRTIRSRRKRIDRIGAILEQHGVISHEERNGGGHPASFFLAARALQGKIVLKGVEIWHVLRWYAHNRGYDGNSGWSTVDKSKEDTAREEAAKASMKKLGTSTMAETVTVLLGLNSENNEPCFRVDSPKYRNLNLAFPRKVVEDEVEQLLRKHADISDSVANLILKRVDFQKEQLLECGVMLPKRYRGSILFGQLHPRFDNRIIARCPITWAQVYSASLKEGASEKEARKKADKFAKVPKADCVEFYEYRFARILANVRVGGEPLSSDVRQVLMQLAKEKGRFTKGEFTKIVCELTGRADNNLKNYFHMVPDADKALVLVPQKDEQKASGRAPYARPILKQVTEEVLRGEDPTKPAYSLTHLNGESKEQDGILYCLSNPESEVCVIQSGRTIEQQTNNHLVRHRMLIFSRLLRDMVSHYADGDARKVTHCCIEVNRELKEFSGLTAKEIDKKLKEKLANFKAAKAYLMKNAPSLPLTGGLIRKCRIAMDMGWTCPYTEMKYSAIDLPKMDREHIVPFADRNTNAMSALVLTFPEVNAMKGKRTALEFIREFQGKPVANRDNLSVTTETRFKKFVDTLDAKGAPDDRKRKALRKKFLLLEKVPEKKENVQLGFTEGQLTQSSQLMKLGAQVAKKQLPTARMVSIPGQVTAEVRKEWKLMGTLAKSTPAILDSDGRVQEKDAIRSITHLHHAVDACTLGLILHLIPSGDNGKIWRLLVQRHVNFVESNGLVSEIKNSSIKIIDQRRLKISDISGPIKKEIALALGERRVVRHVSADYSGASFTEQYSGIVRNGNEYKMLGNTLYLKAKSDVYGVVVSSEPRVIYRADVSKMYGELKSYDCLIRMGQHVFIDGCHSVKTNGSLQLVSVKEDKKEVLLKFLGGDEVYVFNIKDLVKYKIIRKKITPLERTVDITKVVGLKSNKMKKIRAVLEIDDNYGVALEPSPTLIRRKSVYKQLAELKKLNHGKPFRVIRKGMIIRISGYKDAEKNREWVIRAIKNNAKRGLVVDLSTSDYAAPLTKKTPYRWLEVLVDTLLDCNVEVVKQSYIGI